MGGNENDPSKGGNETIQDGQCHYRSSESSGVLFKKGIGRSIQESRRAHERCQYRLWLSLVLQAAKSTKVTIVKYIFQFFFNAIFFEGRTAAAKEGSPLNVKDLDPPSPSSSPLNAKDLDE